MQHQPTVLSPCQARKSFDFTARMRNICSDMVGRLPELAHIDLDQVAVCFCQARKAVQHGIFASLTPLRFKDGALTAKRRGRTYAVQRVCSPDGREMLYVLSFYLPRFQNLDLREKLITILHELWHISPHFNGDIRRHAGRYHAHSHSQCEYDRQMGVLADRWLAAGPPEALWGFLRHDFNRLVAAEGSVMGVKIARPRLIPV